MNMVELCIWSGKCTKRSSIVAMYFSSLTLKARAVPSPNISIDTGTHKTSSDKSLGRTYSWMRDVMGNIENWS